MSNTAIEVDQFLPHAPSTVWRALTDPTLLSRWLMPTDFKPDLGHRFTLDAGRHGITQCEVIAIEPERLLRFSWHNGPLDTIVTWRLEREGTGTRFLIVHDGFDPDQQAHRQAFESMQAGWSGNIMSTLVQVLDSLPPIRDR